MQNALAMRVANRATDQRQHAHARLERIAVAMTPFIERNAVHKFHHEVRRAISGCAGVEDVRDMRMLESGKRDLLRLKSTQRVGTKRAHAKNLHRNWPHHRLKLFATPDYSERALADHLVQTNTTDARRRGQMALVHASEEKICREMLLAWLHKLGLVRSNRRCKCNRSPPASKRGGSNP